MLKDKVLRLLCELQCTEASVCMRLRGTAVASNPLLWGGLEQQTQSHSWSDRTAHNTVKKNKEDRREREKR